MPQAVNPSRSSHASISSKPSAGKNHPDVSVSPFSSRTGTVSLVCPTLRKDAGTRPPGKSSGRQICVWNPMFTLPMSCSAARTDRRETVARSRSSLPPVLASRLRMVGCPNNASKHAPTSARWCSSRWIRPGSLRSDFAHWWRV